MHALQVTQIMVPLLKFYFHEDVRIAAVQCMPELLRAATLAVEKGTSPDASMPAQMLDFFWQPLLDAMHKVGACWPSSHVVPILCLLLAEHVPVAVPSLRTGSPLADHASSGRQSLACSHV
jgi:hypothetical protein